MYFIIFKFQKILYSPNEIIVFYAIDKKRKKEKKERKEKKKK